MNKLLKIKKHHYSFCHKHLFMVIFFTLWGTAEKYKANIFQSTQKHLHYWIIYYSVLILLTKLQLTSAGSEGSVFFF